MEDYTSWTWSFYFLSLLLVFTFSFLSHFPFSGFILNLITPYIYLCVCGGGGMYKTLSQFFWPALEVILINSEVCFISNTRRSGLQFVIALTVLLIQFELIFYISFMTCSIETKTSLTGGLKKENITQQILTQLDKYYRYIIASYFSFINIYVPTIRNRFLLICFICK